MVKALEVLRMERRMRNGQYGKHTVTPSFENLGW